MHFKKQLTLLISAVGIFTTMSSLHAATITVNTTNNNGRYGPIDDGRCAFFEAVRSANTNTAVGGCSSGSAESPDIIEFSLPETSVIDLRDDSYEFAESVIIRGPGRDRLTLRYSSPYGSALFHLSTTSRSIRLDVSHLTLSVRIGGVMNIFARQQVFFDHCRIQDVEQSAGNVLQVRGGSLMMNECQFVSNGNVVVSTLYGDTVIKNSVFSENTGTVITQSRDLSQTSTLEILNTSFIQNTTRYGIISISDNTSRAHFRNVTMANNTVAYASYPIFKFDRDSTVTMKNSILWNNTSVQSTSEGISNCIGGFQSLGHNLFGALRGYSGECVTVPQATDRVENPATPFTNVFGPYDVVRGVLPLAAASPAIDRGSPAGCQNNAGEALEVDQLNNPRHVDGDANATAICDIGAFEYQAYQARCGNGSVDVGEECDDGNAIDDDACLSSCRRAVCGDRVVQRGIEACDNGREAVQPDGCDDSCRVQSISITPPREIMVAAGGIYNSGELVVNRQNYMENVFMSCTFPEGLSGGAGFSTNVPNNNLALTVSAASDAEPGSVSLPCIIKPLSDTSPVRASYTIPVTILPGTCGDGVIQATEVCDDGNRTNGDGCDQNCTVTRCGNGIQTAPEACDDGNGGIDGCSATCQVQSLSLLLVSNNAEVGCGGRVDVPIQLTRSNFSGDVLLTVENGDRGYPFAPVEVINGQSAVQLTLPIAATMPQRSYALDIVATAGGLTHRETFNLNVVTAICGDHVIQYGEVCDDGNLQDGDGCSASCTREASVTTTGGGSSSTGGGEGVPVGGVTTGGSSSTGGGEGVTVGTTSSASSTGGEEGTTVGGTSDTGGTSGSGGSTASTSGDEIIDEDFVGGDGGGSVSGSNGSGVGIDPSMRTGTGNNIGSPSSVDRSTDEAVSGESSAQDSGGGGCSLIR